MFTGGLAVPISDKTWTNDVDPSLKIGGRFGGGRPDLAGFLSVDFTPISGGNAQVPNESAQRYRVLVGVQLWKEVAHHINVAARFGVGMDIAHASYSIGNADHGNTSLGFALEPGGGLWFDVGSVQVGFELGLPISYHDTKADMLGDLAFQYTSIDIDLLGGVRFGM